MTTAKNSRVVGKRPTAKRSRKRNDASRITPDDALNLLSHEGFMLAQVAEDVDGSVNVSQAGFTAAYFSDHGKPVVRVEHLSKGEGPAVSESQRRRKIEKVAKAAEFLSRALPSARLKISKSGTYLTIVPPARKSRKPNAAKAAQKDAWKVKVTGLKAPSYSGTSERAARHDFTVATDATRQSHSSVYGQIVTLVKNGVVVKASLGGSHLVGKRG